MVTGDREQFMTETGRVKINHHMLNFALQTSNTSKEQFSKDLGVNIEGVEKWLKGIQFPTMHQLLKISKKLGRSPYYFMLLAPPDEPPLPADFRFQRATNGKLARETLLAIREARRLQSMANDVMDDLGENEEPILESITINAEPTEVGKKYREMLGINTSVKKMIWGHDDRKAFEDMRDKVESLNIIVLTLPFPVENARGFSLTDTFPFVIGISQKEKSKKAMNFTLFHELGHIILRKGGICIPEDILENQNGNEKVEKWCNRFAAEVLLPEYILRANFVSLKKGFDKYLLNEKISDISKRFYISRQAVAYNLLRINYINQEQYLSLSYRGEERSKEADEGGISPPRWKKSLYSRGNKLARLVYAGNEFGSLTTSDVLGYMSIRLEDYNTMKGAIIEQRK